MEKMIHSPTDINSALAAFVANRATSESPPSKSILSSKIQPGTPIARLRRKTHERSLSHGNGLKSCNSQTTENGIAQHSKSSSLGGVSVNSDSLGLKPTPPPRAKPRRSIQDVNKSSVDHTSSTSSYSEINSELANLHLHMINQSPVPNKYIFPQSHTFLNASSNTQLPNQKPNSNNNKLLFNQLPNNTNFQHNLQQQNFQQNFRTNFHHNNIVNTNHHQIFQAQTQNNNLHMPPQIFAQVAPTYQTPICARPVHSVSKT